MVSGERDLCDLNVDYNVNITRGGLIGEKRLILFRAKVNRKSEQTVLVVGG